MTFWVNLQGIRSKGQAVQPLAAAFTSSLHYALALCKAEQIATMILIFKIRFFFGVDMWVDEKSKLEGDLTILTTQLNW